MRSLKPSAWGRALAWGVALGWLCAPALADEVALPGEWYDTDKTNNGDPFANGNELYGMYWNYWYDADGDGEYTYCEPWVDRLVDQSGQEVDNNPLNGEWDPGEVWPEGWLGARDRSCWAAAAANMILYVGGGSRYVGWLYFGNWVSDPGRKWYEDGTVPLALNAEGFQSIEYHAQCQPWMFDAPAWIRGRLQNGYPVSLAAYWDADIWDRGADGKWGVAGVDDDGANGVDDLGERGWPGSDDFLNTNLGSTHVVNVYAIDTASGTITLADNSKESGGQDYTTFDYTWNGSEFIIPDWNSQHGAAHVNDLATFVVTHWQGSGISWTATDHWHDPANWSLGSVPDPSDPLQIARIEFVEAGLVNISTDAQAQMLTVRGDLTTIRVRPAGTLTLGNLNFADGQMDVEGQVTVRRVDMLGGSIEVDGGSLDVLEDGNGDYGNLNCAGSLAVLDGTLRVDNELAIGVNDAAILTAIRSDVNASEATVLVGDTAPGTLEVYGSRLEAETLYVAHRPTQWGGPAAPGPGHLILDAVGDTGTSVGIFGSSIVVGGQGVGQVTHNAGDVSRAHPAMDFPSMILGYDDTGTGTYALNNGRVYLEDMEVGREGTGTVEQNGGVMQVNQRLEFGTAASGHGTYNLRGGALKVHEVAQGPGGGQLNVDGGILDLTGNSITVEELNVGYDAGTAGEVELTGKTLNADSMTLGTQGEGTFYKNSGSATVGSLTVGYQGTGWLYHDGGDLNADWLCVGRYAGGVGTYVFEHGSAAVGTLEVGHAGTGTFDLANGALATNGTVVGGLSVGGFAHTTGLHDVAGALVLGAWAETGGSGDGTYTLDGGLLQTAETTVGNEGTGLFVQNAGTHTTTGLLVLGKTCSPRAPPGRGTYELHGGNLHTCGTVVGNVGTGTFSQSGGLHEVAGDLVLGNAADAEGTYEFLGGDLCVGGDLRVGLSGGTGTFGMDGTTVQGAGTLYLSGPASSLTGWGTVDMPVVHDEGGIGVLSGALTLKKTYEGLGKVTVFPSGELDLRTHASFSGQVSNTGLFHVSSGVTELLGGMVAGAVGRVTVDAGARLDVASEMDEVRILSVAGQVWHTAGRSVMVEAVELDGVYRLLAGAVLVSPRTEVDGHFRHEDGKHTVGAVWIGGLPDPAGYTIHAGTLEVADLHIGRSYSDGMAPGVLRILDPDAKVLVSNLVKVHPLGQVEAVPGAEIHMTGSAFENESTDPAALSGLARLEFVFEGGPAQIDPFEVACEDRGAFPTGFDHNFALRALTLGGGTDAPVGRVQLLDAFDNQPGWQGAECLYVRALTVGPDSRLDLGGLSLYCITASIDPGATIIGRAISRVAMAETTGVPPGLEVTPVYDPDGSVGMGLGGLNGALLLGGTTTLDPAEVDAAVGASLAGYITLQTYYLEDDLADLGILEETLRPYWWNGVEWVLGGTTTQGGCGVGAFAGINVDAADYGVGFYGLNTMDNCLWNHISHASEYGVAGVPEPATLALLGLGALGLLARRRNLHPIPLPLVEG